MTDSSIHIPNYLAFLFIALVLSPLMYLEITHSPGNSDFFYSYKKYFGFVMLFELILFVFVVAKIIIKYDQIPNAHKGPGMLLSLIFGMILLGLFICWIGYFNGGSYVFEWLSK